MHPGGVMNSISELFELKQRVAVVTGAAMGIGAKIAVQAAGRLRVAAIVLEGHPMAMRMRFLQTLSDIGTEQKNTTIVLPLPLELLKVFDHAAQAERPEGSGVHTAPARAASST
jgi:NAD(P)-dependent dehydrogenase (short-subunit alcohol dehydrogenase family)